MERHEAVIAAEERERIAALLARYPNLSRGELEEIHNWFDRVASALDIGLLSSQSPRSTALIEQITLTGSR